MTALPNTLAHVGRSLADVNGHDKLTGAARYASDFSLAGMLHAKILRSPHPHARIVSIDASKALAVPGVVGVVSGEDLSGLDHTYGMFIRDQPVIAVDKVRFAGEPMAAVAAETEELAYRAIAAIHVEYDVLPAISCIADALAGNAPPLFDGRLHPSSLQPPPLCSSWVQEPAPNILFDFSYSFGDIEALFAGCAHISEDRFTLARQSHAALEPHVAIAFASDHEHVEVWSNNQDPFLLREDIARIFGLSAENVRFHAGLVGGGFGSKSYCKIEPIAVLLARKTGRPVRLALTMAESMMTVCDHPAEIRLRTGVSASGETVVRDAVVELDGGAYADASPSVAMRMGTRFNGPYRWKGVRTRVRVIRTTTIPAGSFRGFGMGHVTWACESQMDMIAGRIGLHPAAFRAQNFLDPGSSGAPGERVLDCDLTEGFNAVRNRIADKTTSANTNRGTGFAVACKGGGSSHRADARIDIHPTGDVTLAAGVTEIGQNTRTILTQVAAEVLGMDTARIRVVNIDTHSTPFDSGTHASNGATVAGLAVRDAATKAAAEVLLFAAGRLQCRVEDLSFRQMLIVHGSASYSLSDLIDPTMKDNPASFSGAASVQTPGGSLFWMPIWTVAEVEVDDETGIVRLTRLINAADVGRAINPQRCISQIEGAAAQGLGQALFEDISYRNGQPLTATPLTYRMPRLADIPADFETIILEQGRGPGPFGAKGVGESGNLTIPAAIANAIADAVGARVMDLPMTPDKILRAIRAKAGASPSGR
ncbi:xanthine dehydrogenase family protein molybdopterin-binding subunit [Roseiarcaceae bacterium H3SJ34-1]|uniref:xanthine dehydrogenase family protein molybdopterin-binding subunit n=1 Tax=Terripilifer ovatus TaxID=3032367 RepID=UPI003AB9909E|nr:xanthine dehydrogenase family protein molybdopterin-binding subunit [Roseiarcaceae bacterium H3SJ34-1]